MLIKALTISACPPSADFTQIAFDVVQRATGEVIAPAPVKKAPAARKMPAKVLKATKPPAAG